MYQRKLAPRRGSVVLHIGRMSRRRSQKRQGTNALGERQRRQIAMPAESAEVMIVTKHPVGVKQGERHSWLGRFETNSWTLILRSDQHHESSTQRIESKQNKIKLVVEL